MRVAPWSWRCESSISYYFTFALCNCWQPIAINLRCILHDNTVAPLGQSVCVYRSSVVFYGCGNWVVYIVWAFVSVLLINCCWLVINFKSWSKNANRFEQYNIFTTDTKTTMVLSTAQYTYKRRKSIHVRPDEKWTIRKWSKNRLKIAHVRLQQLETRLSKASAETRQFNSTIRDRTNSALNPLVHFWKFL